MDHKALIGSRSYSLGRKQGADTKIEIQGRDRFSELSLAREGIIQELVFRFRSSPIRGKGTLSRSAHVDNDEKAVGMSNLRMVGSLTIWSISFSFLDAGSVAFIEHVSTDIHLLFAHLSESLTLRGVDGSSGELL